MKTGAPHRWEWTGPDGPTYDIFDFPFADADSSPLVMEMGIDVTERKRAEAALKDLNQTLEQRVAERTSALEASEVQLHAIIENLTEGLVVADLEGLLFHWNRAALEMHGFASVEECRRHLPEFTKIFELSSTDGSVLPVEQWPLARILRGEPVRDRDVRVRRLDGQAWERIFSYGGALVRDPAGQPLMALVTVSDITARKQAEEELRRAKEEWEQTFDTVPDFVAVLDGSHRIVRANRAMAERLGRTPEQCIGLKCHEAVHNTPEPPGFCPHARTCRDGLEHSAEVQEPRLGGTFLVSTSPRFDSQRRLIGAVHVARNITHLKRAEAVLRSRLRLSELAQNGSAGELILTALDDAETHTGSSAGYFVFVDEGQAGLPAPAWSTRTIRTMPRAPGWRLSEPINNAGLYAECVRSRAAVIWNGDGARALTASGFPVGHPPVLRSLAVPILRGGAVTAVVAVANKPADYTQDDAGVLQELGSLAVDLAAYRRSVEARDQMARALRQSQEDLNRAQAVARTGSWRLNVQRNELLWSDETYRIFDIPKGTPLTYETFLAAVLPGDRQHVQEKWSAALRGEPYDIEHRIVAAGATKWVRERAELEFDQGGRLLGGFGTCQDITERKQAEEALRQLNAELEDRVRDRTAELRQRADQLALLASQLTLAEQRERRRLAQLLHDHLQQLLVGAKFGLEVLARTLAEDHRPRVAQVQGLLDESIKASRSLTVELSPPILHEAGLAAALEWLGRWMEDRHGLIVDLEAHAGAGTDREDVKVLLFQSVRELLFNAVKHARVTRASVALSMLGSDDVHIVVSDSGVGFDPEAMWARSGRLDSGFGLFSIRERLVLLGGRFEIESAPQMGARFTLIAPAKPARRAAERAPRPPDVILMDFSLPGMDGVEATRIIHAELPGVRVIGLSMYEEADRSAAMLAAGAAAYVSKTERPDVLLAAIRGG